MFIFMVFIHFPCQIDEWDTLLDDWTSVCFATFIFKVLYLFIFLEKLMNESWHVLLELYSWYCINFLCHIDEWTSVCFARILFIVFINFPCQRAPARGVIGASD